MTDKLLYTVQGAADLLSVSRDTIERLLNDGALPAVRLRGGPRRIPTAALEAFVAAQWSAPNAPVASNVASNKSGNVVEISRGMRISQSLRARNAAKRRGDAAQ